MGFWGTGLFPKASEMEQASEGVKLVPLVELLGDELELKGTS